MNESHPPLPLIEPDLDAHYSLEVVAEITGIATQTILHYREEGLLPSGPTAARKEEIFFDDATLCTLRRIDHLARQYEMSTPALKLLCGLLEEVESLRAALRSRH